MVNSSRGSGCAVDDVELGVATGADVLGAAVAVADVAVVVDAAAAVAAVCAVAVVWEGSAEGCWLGAAVAPVPAWSPAVLEDPPKPAAACSAAGIFPGCRLT